LAPCDCLNDCVFRHSTYIAGSRVAGEIADAEPGARLTCHLLLRLFKVTHV